MKDVDDKDEIRTKRALRDEEEPEDEPEKEKEEEQEDKPSPKINFDYKHGEEGSEEEDQSETIKRRPLQPDSLDDLAEEDEQSEDQEPVRAKTQEAAEEESDIPHMRYQQRTNPGLYSKQYDPGDAPSRQSTFQERPIRRAKSSPLPLIILLLVGVAIVGGTVFLLKNRSVKWPTGSNSATPAPTSAAAATPTPTETPVPLDRSKFTIQVLNGTKTTGLAKSVADKLQGLGYQIDKTGNATNSAFERTVVVVKKDEQSLADQLVKDLAGQFDATSSTSLTGSVDGQVILGAK